jgi:hypothetical protein
MMPTAEALGLEAARDAGENEMEAYTAASGGSR